MRLWSELGAKGLNLETSCKCSMLRRFDIHHLSMYSFSHGETRIPICLRSTNILGLNAIQLLKLLQHGPLALPGHRVKRCKFLDAIGTSSKNGQEYQK